MAPSDADSRLESTRADGACRGQPRGRYRPRWPITAKGKKVVIIGGGDTADCWVRTASAIAVQLLEITPRPPDACTPWPTYPPWPGWSARRWRAGVLGQHRGVGTVRGRGAVMLTVAADFELEADRVAGQGFVGPERLLTTGSEVHRACGDDFDTRFLVCS